MHTRNPTRNKLSEIDAVILCGGVGKRLRSVVNDRPKPMAQINDRPFLDILVESFAEFGLRRFVLCAGYMSDIIRDYYTEKSNFVGWGSPHHPLKFVISDEHKPLGTAGAIKNAAKHIRSDTFLVANGDSFCSVDLGAFYDFHSARLALMSMVVVETQNTGDCGLVSIDDSQRITGFEEKNAQSHGRYINAGIYLFQKEALSLIPENTSFSLERELFPKLIEQNCYAFATQGRLFDIGTPARFAAAIKHLARDQLQPSQIRS
ncbi:MAG: nucleotidyltransferase family protein [Phycisphaerales bacterium]|nr:MAG: nucleotidyltransferase family protein [Phycisphaerales bacterium]